MLSIALHGFSMRSVFWVAIDLSKAKTAGDMTNGKVWKIILLFTLPIMAGNLLQQLYNVVDGVIVGNFVGEMAFASIATCIPLVAFYLALSIGLSVGVGVVVSQYYGAEKGDKLPSVIDTALILLGACGLGFTVLGIVFSPFLLSNILKVPDSILRNAVIYMRIYSGGLFFQFLYNGVAATLRSFGDSKATLYFLLISTVLNTVLDLLFVLGLNMSVAGAAIATVISQAVCVTVSYVYLRKRYPYIRSGEHWNRGIAATMTRLGFPIAIQQGIVSFGNGAMQRLVNGFALTAPGLIAAYGAATRLDAFRYVPILGFQSGLASFTGQNTGAGRLDRVKRGFISAIIMSVSVTVILSVLFYIFAGPVISLFGLSDESLRIGIEQVRFIAMVLWMFAAYMALCGLLQGSGDTLLMSVATLTALAVRIATGYIAVHFGWLGYNAAWLTTPIGWLIAMSITFTRYFTGGWKNKAVAGKLSNR